MQFNSIEFIVFLPVVASVCFLLPFRFQWVFLLAASYFFYMAWKPAYIVLIVASTVIDYVAALAIYAARTPRLRKAYLVVSLSSNLGLLFAFKYFDFFALSGQWLLDAFHLPYHVPLLDVLLPVGISFYTFQSMSYTIDVYQGLHAPERNLGRFALYVTFFPQLVAGPIERSYSLLPQLRQHFVFDAERTTEGLRLILWGLFKKMVIADRLATVVDRVYGHPFDFEGPALVVATLFFAYQIYYDFSGYSDIAIGAARIFNVDLMMNFNRPYVSRSIPEFWNRWHISLSTWFRDYLYIPLGGNRRGKWRQRWNILVVFTLSGLWHGANWTFLIWGLLHASYYLLNQVVVRPKRWLYKTTGLESIPRLLKTLQIAVTFVMVCVGWVFFRAASVKEALYVLAYSSVGWDGILTDQGMKEFLVDIRCYPSDFLFAVACVVFVEMGEYLRSRGGPVMPRLPQTFRWAVYLVCSLIIMNYGVIDEVAFIYFQF